MPRTDAQKRADKTYRESHKGDYKLFSTGFKAAEAEHIENVLKAHNLSKADFVRRGVARLERGEDL